VLSGPSFYIAATDIEVVCCMGLERCRCSSTPSATPNPPQDTFNIVPVLMFEMSIRLIHLNSTTEYRSYLLLVPVGVIWVESSSASSHLRYASAG